MREQSYPTDEETAIKNQVPSPPSVRKSKRKMDRSKLGGRGLFKNPPQPHMCIRDALVGSQEPCFINVLSWDKISLPQYPEDTIPLYGGIQIICSSMNSLVCTEFLKEFEPGKQPAIYAVVVNPHILKMSGKNANEANRDSFIYLIEDFVENMNEAVKFQHQFTVLVDRDVVGELKDIWFIIQSKREQERLELSSQGDGDRNLAMRHNAIPKAPKQYTRPQESTAVVPLQKLFLLYKKKKAPVPHFHPQPNEAGNKEPGWHYTRQELDKCKEGSQEQKITNLMPTYRKDQDELVWLQYPPKLSVSGCNYITPFSKLGENFWSVGNASKPAPPSFQESIGNKVRTFAQKRNQEKHNHTHVSVKPDKPLLNLPSERRLASNKNLQAIVTDRQEQLESLKTETEGDDMFDRIRHVVAKKILPSLDGLDNEYGEISSPYFALEEVAKKPYKEDVMMKESVENVNNIQLSELTDALLSLNALPEEISSPVSEISPLSCTEINDLIQENLLRECLEGGSNSPHDEAGLKPGGSDKNVYLEQSLQNVTLKDNSIGEMNGKYIVDTNHTFQSNAANHPSSAALDRNKVQDFLNRVNKNVIGPPDAVKINSFCADCCVGIDEKDANINLQTTENLETLNEITLIGSSKAIPSSASVEVPLKKEALMMINCSENGSVRRTKSFTDLNLSIHGGNGSQSAHLRDN